MAKLKFDTEAIFHLSVIKNINNLLGKDQDVIVVMKDAKDFNTTLSSDKVYFIDGVIDFTGTGISINVPPSGINIQGYGSDLCGLRCDDDNYTLLTNTTDAGNVFGSGFYFEVTGVNSKVHDIKNNTGFAAVEYDRVNFINCSSLGVMDSYRQYLEVNTGRFQGTPELTFSGSWGGARISTSLAIQMDNFTSLFKAGTNLTFDGRFITDINCDLPSTGALLDFSASNIVNEESLILKGTFIRRQGIIDASDSTIFPNLDNTDVKCLWSDNTGVPNTHKYVKSKIDSEVETVITDINQYVPLQGVWVQDTASHFSSNASGEFTLLSGNGTYQLSGEIVIVGTANEEIDIRMVKSLDGGVSFTEEINHVKRRVNNLSGNRDVALFPINFTSILNKGDVVRVEVENKTSNNNVTAEVDSDISITAI